MDPNANLKEQAYLLEQPPTADRRARLKELRLALRDWLDGGGFEPDWSAYRRAAATYDAWLMSKAATHGA